VKPSGYDMVEGKYQTKKRGMLPSTGDGGARRKRMRVARRVAFRTLGTWVVALARSHESVASRIIRAWQI